MSEWYHSVHRLAITGRAAPRRAYFAGMKNGSSVRPSGGAK
jgi:hypothetical protein